MRIDSRSTVRENFVRQLACFKCNARPKFRNDWSLGVGEDRLHQTALPCERHWPNTRRGGQIMQIGARALHHEKQGEMEPMKRHASTERPFSSYFPKNHFPKDLTRDRWETERGLAFIRRQRIESSAWESPGLQPAGLYHAIVHATDCRLTTKYNSRVRHSGFFPANTIQFIPPDADVHSTGCGSLRFLGVSFTPNFLAKYLESLSANPDVVELRDVASTDDVGLARLAQAYEAVSANGIASTQLYFDTLRQAMFHRILLRHASRPIKHGREVLVPAKACRVIDYIEANLASDLHLAELSTIAGISRAHFARAFRNTVGMAPHMFVLQRRLARAVEWLTPRKLSIREVAARCGFADQAHLTRAFKAQFGHPPSLHVAD
jgi:AraC-like DNA-binding protein